MRKLLLTTRRSFRAALVPLMLFCIFWLGILAIPETGFELLGVFAAMSVIMTSGGATFILKMRASSSLFRIVPGYDRAHIGAGLGISLASVILSAAVLAGHGLEFVPVFAALWLLSVMAVIGIYFLDFYLLPLPVMILVAVRFWSDLRNPIPYLARLLTTEFTLPLLIVNAVLTTLIIRRMLAINEEAVEYFDVQRVWAKASTKRESRARQSLDSIPQSLPQNLRAQIRHLQLRTGFLPGTFPKLTVAFVAMFLFLRFINSSEVWPLILRIIPLMPLWALVFPPRRSAQRFFMLPLRRSELILKNGVAMGLLLLKVSGAAAIALTVAAWRLPPWDFLFIATALQVAVFGACALISSIHEGWKRMSVVVLLNAVGIFGLKEWSGSSIYFPVSLCLIVGAAMIGLSYYRWCNVDVD